jgi:two-component system, OmpR family, response regulator
MTPKAHLLIVDDDKELCALLSKFLTAQGYRVSVAHNGSAMATILQAARINLVILDLMLPGEDGLVLCRRLRATSTLPIIMLTAMGEEVDRIIGLEMGADDYLPKPFNPRELVARIRAVLRRARDRRVPAEALTLGPLKLDPARHRALVRGAAVELTGAEFRVLEVLLRSAGQVVSREQLTEQALGRKLELYDRSVDTHVSNLRRKLALGAPDEPEIRGIRGAGYLLTRPGEEILP